MVVEEPERQKGRGKDGKDKEEGSIKMYPVSLNWTPDSSFTFTMTKTIGDSLGETGDLNHSLNPYEMLTVYLAGYHIVIM